MTTEHQRLTILRALAEDTVGSHNESILQSILNEFGLACGRDKLRTMLSWLQEQDLVSLREAAGLMVAQITHRGVDVATGVASVPGVKHPSPGRD